MPWLCVGGQEIQAASVISQTHIAWFKMLFMQDKKQMRYPSLGFIFMYKNTYINYI